MQCSNCNAPYKALTVIETRVSGECVRRRRACMACGGRFSTVETAADLGRDANAASLRFLSRRSAAVTLSFLDGIAGSLELALAQLKQMRQHMLKSVDLDQDLADG